MRAFADFWINPKIDSLVIPGKCLFGGEICIDDELELADVEIFSSPLKLVERIRRGQRLGVSHDLMQFTTMSGEKYNCYSDTCNSYMGLMLDDYFHVGKLDRRRWTYVPWGYRNNAFL